MKISILLVVILIGLAQARISCLDAAEDEFRSFKEKYQRVYANADEELKRMKIFMDNKKLIDSHNKRYAEGEETYEMEVNEFTDLLPSEFESEMLTYSNESEMAADMEYDVTFRNDVKAPSAIDWRVKGAVTPVKNQKHCGSCWAFAAAAVLESRNFLKNKILIPLSEQNLIDCSGSYGNNGCRNGSVTQALRYVMGNGGLNTEKSYPYKARKGQCRFNPKAVNVTVSKIVRVPPNVNALANAVASGPVAVVIDVTKIRYYKKGVFSGPCPKKPRHAVLLVGYDKNYWIFKNSWGRSWGEKGYFRLARNKNNTCHIETRAIFPEI